MWASLINLAKNAGAFLSSNKVPPGTPIALQDAMRKENHLTSKKFFMVYSAFAGVLLFYFVSIIVLFLLPSNNEVVAGYVTIFSKTIEVVAIIVASYLGVQAAIDFRYGSSSNTNFDAVLTSEQREEKIIQEETILYAEKYKDDLSYAPLEWVFNQNNG
jgi:hypothetical protein